MLGIHLSTYLVPGWVFIIELQEHDANLQSIGIHERTHVLMHSHESGEGF